MESEPDKPTSVAPLDINSALSSNNFSLSLSPPESPEDAEHRRKKDWYGFILATGIVLSVTGVALYLQFFHAEASATEKKWALATLSSVMGAVGGFLIGRK